MPGGSGDADADRGQQAVGLPLDRRGKRGLGAQEEARHGVSAYAYPHHEPGVSDGQVSPHVAAHRSCHRARQFC